MQDIEVLILGGGIVGLVVVVVFGSVGCDVIIIDFVFLVMDEIVQGVDLCSMVFL